MDADKPAQRKSYAGNTTLEIFEVLWRHSYFGHATHPLNAVTTPVVNADGIETGSNGKVNLEVAERVGRLQHL